MAVNLIKVLQL